MSEHTRKYNLRNECIREEVVVAPIGKDDGIRVTSLAMWGEDHEKP